MKCKDRKYTMVEYKINIYKLWCNLEKQLKVVKNS